MQIQKEEPLSPPLKKVKRKKRKEDEEEEKNRPETEHTPEKDQEKDRGMRKKKKKENETKMLKDNFTEEESHITSIDQNAGVNTWHTVQ